MIEASVYETTAKPMPLRKRLQFIRLIMVVFFLIGFIMPMPSSAAPGTNSFTGSASVTDRVTFVTTGSMNVNRIWHTATLLDNGKVLVAGALNGIYRLASAELYDPSTSTWTSTGSLNVARCLHTATLLNNGKVLVVAGEGGGDPVSAELYDPATGIWSNTGNMNVARSVPTATLLNNGEVLVAGGQNGDAIASAELYDPSTGTWSTTGSMNVARATHTATLLNNGKVLVAGGYVDSSTIASAELYDPVTGIWSTTGSMNAVRQFHTATLLNNGKVLVAGGYGLSSAELYDPVAGTWSTTGNMNVTRNYHTATLLSNGKLLVEGGYGLSSTELYDPVAGTWSTTGNMNVARYYHAATLLNDGKVLLVAGEGGGDPIASAELGSLIPGNTFTGTLTLPSGWLSSTTISTQFAGTTSAAAINAGALSNDNNTWGSWIAATSAVTTTTTWDVGSEGANKPIYLRLRDINDQMTTVVIGTVNVDLTKPITSITALPSFVGNTTIPLTWSGSDALSGISTFDVQVRAGTGGTWTDVLSNTTNTNTNYTGANIITYYFRTRARDVAGNVEDWPADYDTFTVVDTDAPSGMVVINGGALTTTSINVSLSLSATDAPSGVAMMSFSNDGSAWSAWQSYATQASWTLLSGDGTKTVYTRFRDAAGNVSLPISDTIELDTATEAEYGLTINNGAVYTNQTAVTLTIGAQSGTAQMQVSNDGGFAGATWEPYASHKTWTIIQYGSYVIPRLVYIRFKDSAGVMSGTFQDDIILDVNAPTGSVIITSATATIGAAISASPLDAISDLSVQAASLQFKIYLPLVFRSGQPCQGCVLVRALLNATDDVSGVGYVIISNNDANFTTAVWEVYATEKNWQVPYTGTTTVYVKFRDNAGNISTTYSATYTP